MRLLLFTAFLAAFSFVNAGKTARLLAAMNAGMLNGVMGGGLNAPLVAGGGVGFIGQPQFAQFVPGLPAFAVRAPIPNVFPAAVNAYQVPYMGAPQMAQGPQIPQIPQMPQMAQMAQMAQMNPVQQPQLMGMQGAPMQQQLPVQPDPLRRFRRQIMKPLNTLSSTADTQIVDPTGSTTPPPCDKKHQDETN